MTFPQKVYADELDRAIQELATEFETLDLGEAILGLAPLVYADIEKHFLQAQGPNGAWPPRKHYYPWPILIKTGKLKGAASVQGGEGNITRFRDGWGEFGVDGSVVNYAGFHEYGTQYLPPRPWAWLSDDAKEKAGEALLVSLEALLFG